MAGKYGKNFTEKGYLMKYEKLTQHAELKNRVYQFRIELLGIEPTIWRRIQVPSDYNFWDLHVAVNDAMGWLDYHLHHFEIKRKGKRGFPKGIASLPTLLSTHCFGLLYCHNLHLDRTTF